MVSPNGCVQVRVTTTFMHRQLAHLGCQPCRRLQIHKFQFMATQGVQTFTPSTSTDGGVLHYCVHRYFDGHTLLDRGIPKVRHQTLQNTHVADQESWNDLLLQFNDNACQTTNQITIAFATRKSKATIDVRRVGAA